MQLITNLVRAKREESGLGRRQLLLSGAAGLAVVVLPACGADQVPYFVPPTYGPNGPGPDGGSPHPDEGGVFPTGESSSGATDSGASQMDTGGGGSDSTSPPDTGGGVDSSSGGTTCSMSGNVLTLTFSQYPQLMSVGGNVAVQAPGYSDPNCGASDIVVFQVSAGKYVALSAGCNHVCCTAGFNGSDIRCPCHGATWDLSGKLTRGPATANLASLSVCADSAGVHVTLP